jgi:GR25 family glycosyltransferase involved in LPS biosynthesis
MILEYLNATTTSNNYIKIYLVCIIIFLIIILTAKLYSISKDNETNELEHFNSSNYKSKKHTSTNTKTTHPYDITFIINLNETAEGRRRWNIIRKIKQFHNIHRFPGVYGKKYNYIKELENGIINESWDIGLWKDQESKIIIMDKGEIGINLSYYRLFNKIVKDNIKTALILEDDAIDLDPNFENIVNEHYKLLPEDWDIFLLGFWLHRGDNGHEVVPGKIYKVRDFVLLHSFIISNKGAKKLLNHLPIDMPMDSWISKWAHIDINIYRHNYILQDRVNPVSKLIRQKRDAKQIKNTNNW